jgi:c-di-AMP phosphodiesterase-like protein
MEQGLTSIQTAINEILNVKSLIRRKKKNQSDKKKELFISIINAIEHVSNRQNLMYVDLQVDFTTYDDSFLDIIDALIVLHFGKEGAELIAYYLWDRVNPDGSINALADEDNNPVVLETASDLWDTLLLMNPKYGS